MLLQLTFKNTLLDVAEIYTDFNFNTTRRLTIDMMGLLTVREYMSVDFIKVVLDSPIITTEFIIGAIIISALTEEECRPPISFVLLPGTSNLTVTIGPTLCMNMMFLNIETIQINCLMYSGEKLEFIMT